jgi:hypothetical protein
MYWFLGDTIHREEIKVNKNIMVKIINHKSTDKKLFDIKQKWFKGRTTVDTVKMITNLCSIESRTNKIVEIITHLRRTEPNRKILVLSGRKSHLDILKKRTDDFIKSDIDKGIIDEDEIYSCYYIGETKQVKREEAEEKGDIIFATYDMANEGLDIKHLNTVILASPKKDVIQSIGRIMRTILKSGDIKPLIIDIADDIDVISNWLKIRENVYTKCKYIIENYYLVDNDFKTYQKYIDPNTKQYLHYENSYIHNLINQQNIYFNNWKKSIEKYYSILSKNNKDYALKYKDKRKVLDNIEYTSLNDILYIASLKDSDFSTDEDSNQLDKIIEFNCNNNNVVKVPTINLFKRFYQ